MADSKNRQDKNQDQAKVGRGPGGGAAEGPDKDRQDEGRNKMGQQGAQDRKLDRDIKEQQDTEGGRQPQGMRPAPASPGMQDDDKLADISKGVASDVDNEEDEDADENAVTQRTPSQRDVVQPKK